ncbi:hypothetical protein [Rhodoferax fermentans]|uniref:hypothetical protein n=1 Tax=Rhodoferax fermentans TaxID=28066 RepID=UPI00117AB075|nr:hypothetical protein [Rhodoferax fermentans]
MLTVEGEYFALAAKSYCMMASFSKRSSAIVLPRLSPIAVNTLHFMSRKIKNTLYPLSGVMGVYVIAAAAR